jgi:hypothetical protein
MPFIKRAIVEGIEFVEGPVDTSLNFNKEIIEKIVKTEDKKPLIELIKGEQV